MKYFSYQISYKDLAKLFVTSRIQVMNYIQRGKFDPNDLTTVFRFYGETYSKIKDRQDQWNGLYKAYIQHLFRRNSPERKFIEENLRDWGRKSEILSY